MISFVEWLNNESNNQIYDDVKFMDELANQLRDLSPKAMMAQLADWDAQMPGISKKVLAHIQGTRARDALREIKRCGEPQNQQDAENLVYFHNEAIKIHKEDLSREKDPNKRQALIKIIDSLIKSKETLEMWTLD